MKTKSYILYSGIVFSIVFLGHLLRTIYGWEMNIGTWEVPIWVSVVAFLITGCLAWKAYKLSR